MSKIENLKLQLVPGSFSEEGQPAFVAKDGRHCSVSKKSIAFLKYCTGSFSCAEIAQILYQKGVYFRFGSVLEDLLELDEKQLFKSGISESTASAILHTKSNKGIPQAVINKKSINLYLQKINLFRGLDSETMKRIQGLCELVTYEKGDFIIRRGSQGADAYALLNGGAIVSSLFKTFEVSKSLAEIPLFSVFGESAAISGKTRTADVVAKETTSLLKFNIQKVMEPVGSEKQSSNLKIRLVLSQILKSHPLFKNLPEELTSMFMSCCSIQRFPKETSIVQQGDMGEDFYFIVSGEALVLKDGLPEVSLKTGNYFGEIAVLNRTQRTATVMTSKESLLLKINGKSFMSILSKNFELAHSIEQVSDDRSGVGDLVSACDVTIINDNEITFIEKTTQKHLDEVTDWDFVSMEGAQ